MNHVKCDDWFIPASILLEITGNRAFVAALSSPLIFNSLHYTSLAQFKIDSYVEPRAARSRNVLGIVTYCWHYFEDCVCANDAKLALVRA